MITWYDSHPYHPINPSDSIGMFYMLLYDVYNACQLVFRNNVNDVPFTLTVTLGTMLSETGYLSSVRYKTNFEMDGHLGSLVRLRGGLHYILGYQDNTMKNVMLLDTEIFCY